MLQVMFNDEIINIPRNVTKTEEIFELVSSAKNVPPEKLLLLINSIYITYEDKAHLVDLGYYPNEKMIMKVNDTKQIIFNILPFNFKIQKTINACTSVFKMKKIFSRDFFTVPQNINIKLKGKILPDDILLFNSIEEAIPFDIEVDENHILCYTFSEEFRYICITKDSTIKNIEDTISMYTEKDINSIKDHFSIENQNIDTNSNIQEHSSIIKPLKFIRNSCSKVKPFTINITVIDNDNNNRVIQKFSIQSSVKTNVYRISCLLERFFQIDRQLFVAFSKKDDMIQSSSEIGQNLNSDLKFKILKQLKVKIRNKIEKVSYFTKVKDIQYKERFDKQNFGIIVNNNFAFPDELHPFLISFLNDSKEDQFLSEIKISHSKISCHEKRYIKCTSRGEEEKADLLIVPDSMNPNEIWKTFFHRSFLSIQILDNKDGIIWYKYSTCYKVKYNFIDKEGNNEELTAEIDGENPRISDLLNKIYYQRRSSKLIDGCIKYKVLFKDEEIFFYMKLSDIFCDEINVLTIVEIESVDQENIKIYDFSSSSNELNFKQTSICTANDIIRQMKFGGCTLYLDFNKLNPNDIPSIYSHINDFYIINKIKPISIFTISNTILETTYHFHDDQYDKTAEIIKSLFRVENIPSKFKLKIFNEEYQLPSTFDCGSFLSQSKIFINYSAPQLKCIKILHERKERIMPVPDSDVPIFTLNQEIMKTLNYYKCSEQAFRLCIYEKTLLPTLPFKNFKITQRMIMTLSKGYDSFAIQVSTSNEAFKKEYFFTNKDTIFDLKIHLKNEFNYTEAINITNPDFNSIDDEANLVKGMKLIFYAVPKVFKYQNQEFKIEHLLTVFEATKFIQDNLKQFDVYIFKKNEKDDSYEILDDKKRLFEYEPCEFFLQKILPDIEFSGYEITFSKDNKISEQNTLLFFKRKFISPLALTSEANIIVSIDEKLIDDSKLMKDLINGKRMNIIINDISVEGKANIRTSLKKKSSLTKIIPTYSIIKEETDDFNKPFTHEHKDVEKPEKLEKKQTKEEDDFNKPLKYAHKDVEKPEKLEKKQTKEEDDFSKPLKHAHKDVEKPEKLEKKQTKEEDDFNKLLKPSHKVEENKGDDSQKNEDVVFEEEEEELSDKKENSIVIEEEEEENDN
ncbi:hypothetical protein M9Y10_031642 [Tritrichomonas musculus]|uniref:Ubiquitin-like domain-containing protein n=1 Tax=Tritrichomonas musculus TaxID=1915356 RepID=A0ABR2H2W9_9EUKA